MIRMSMVESFLKNAPVLLKRWIFLKSMIRQANLGNDKQLQERLELNPQRHKVVASLYDKLGMNSLVDTRGVFKTARRTNSPLVVVQQIPKYIRYGSKRLMFNDCQVIANWK